MAARSTIFLLLGTALPLLSGPSLAAGKGFQVPGPAQRVEAIGDADGLPEPLRRALVPGPGFEPIAKPEPGDWLAAHPERGQTFEDFRRMRRNTPTSARSKIYLQPLGTFETAGAPSIETLREFAAAFFGMKVETLESAALDEKSFTPRVNAFTGKRQLLTTDILRFLEKRLPGDAYCLLGITMEDLYPDPTWNFVFGQASIRNRTGVYSFVRYDPAFRGGRREKGFEKLVLRRSCRVLAHETGHMFGMLHCVYFRCLMNGSNHLRESDASPLRLCPVCLRKLQSSAGFDVVDRYRTIRGFFAKAALPEEAAWFAARLRWIEQGGAGGKAADPERGGASASKTDADTRGSKARVKEGP